MFTIMHLSDIHRSESDPISNDELVSCLIADISRFDRESPRISRPEAIVVSGDLVQGVPLGAADYPGALAKQYEEALDLLGRLSDAFVRGERNKVIIVPGNHDVDWNAARQAMVYVQPVQQGINVRSLLSLPNSPYRWSWRDLQLYSIKHLDLYGKRFAFFSNLYEEFYRTAQLSFPLDSRRAWNLFSLADDRIAVCAFNSCTSNDCFSEIGEITASLISQSHVELLNRRLPCVLLIAVWHHDIAGPPRRSDYMDADAVRILIDRGYRLGLHGHQHRADAVPYSIYTSEKQTMAVISAGSLCAGFSDLPRGCSRQYNIIEISDDYAHARIHVREMSFPGIFSPGRLLALGWRSFTDVGWSAAALEANMVNVGRDGGSLGALVDEIEQLISGGSYDDAIVQIREAADRLAFYGRQLLAKALFKAQRWDELADHLRQPQNDDELDMCLRALVQLKRWEAMEELFQDASNSGRFAPATIRNLKRWANAEKELYT